MNDNKTSVAVDLPEALINIAREIEALKRDCGMDPESAIAIQNGRYMALSYKVRTLAAGQAVAQPVGTWCDGCSPENCGGCHIPSNAATPAQAPSQPGGFSAGDMASAAAQGYRDGWTAAQADSVLEDAARYQWLRQHWFTMSSNYKGCITFRIGEPRWSDITEEALDAAIDAAMTDAARAAQKEGEKP